MSWRRVVLALAMCLLCAPSISHELQPGFLELIERDPGRYQVLWKQPIAIGVTQRLVPVFPDSCRASNEPAGEVIPGAWLYRAQIECTPNLAGQTLTIEGLEAFSTDVLVRVQHHNGSVETHLLKPIQPSITIGTTEQPQRKRWTYLLLGIEHIALGIDHLLFVLGLLLIVRDRWMLVKTITAFTVAHSISLAAATFAVIQVPAAPLNAAIALSILFLGPEIVRVWRGQTASQFGTRGWLRSRSVCCTDSALPAALSPSVCRVTRFRWRCCCSISVLRSVQLAFVAVVIALERAYAVLEVRWTRWAQLVPGYVVGVAGAYWTIETARARCCKLFDREAMTQRLQRCLLIAVAASMALPAIAYAHADMARHPAFLRDCGIRFPDLITCWRWSQLAYGAPNSAVQQSGCCRSRFR